MNDNTVEFEALTSFTGEGNVLYGRGGVYAASPAKVKQYLELGKVRVVKGKLPVESQVTVGEEIELQKTDDEVDTNIEGKLPENFVQKRIRTALEKAGLTTIDQVAEKTPEELLEIDGISQAAVTAIGLGLAALSE